MNSFYKNNYYTNYFPQKKENIMYSNSRTNQPPPPCPPSKPPPKKKIPPKKKFNLKTLKKDTCTSLNDVECFLNKFSDFIKYVKIIHLLK